MIIWARCRIYGEEWPEAKVVGSYKAKTVFEREGAIRTIKRLGTEAAAYLQQKQK